MTFEETDTRAQSAGGEEGGRTIRQGRRGTPRRATDLDTMMQFVVNTETIASNIRGVAALFKGTFIETNADLPDEQGYAADIVEECLLSIAKRLDDNAQRARQTQQHLERGTAR